MTSKATGCGGGARANTPAAERWSSLPGDLLSISYLRLTTTIDRVRFAAVCTAWRAAASRHLPRSALPWLILDPSGAHRTNRVYCPEEGVVLPRLSLPGEAVQRCLVGSHEGGWIASSQAPFKIINFFTDTEVALSAHTRPHTDDPLLLRKVVFSEQPTLSSCILAGVTRMHMLAVYKVGCPEAGWTIRGPRGNDHLMDIAFCNGELYGTTQNPKYLIKFEFVVNKHGALVGVKINYRFCMLESYRENPEHIRYIVELRGELVMVVRGYRSYKDFTAFRLVHGNIGLQHYNYYNYPYKWVEVHNFGDYALFLGPTCSKAVQVPAGARCDIQKNHIYFSHHRCLRRNSEIPRDGKVFFTSLNDDGYRVYYKKEERVLSKGYYAIGVVRPPMWIFPPGI
uniref:KIB1-4 beta-propeller domain-containing protein n=1 Tax=Aegilops tauschii TaxID=37682 RepID=N1QRU7_AEGTA